MSQTQQHNEKNEKKNRGLFGWRRKKDKHDKHNKNDIQSDDEPNGHNGHNGHNGYLQNGHNEHNEHNGHNQQNGYLHNGHNGHNGHINNNNNNDIKTDENGTKEIDDLVDRMTNILNQLKELCKINSNHTVDLERFQKLIEWVGYNESHLSLLKQAWNDESFWPFLSTPQATDQVANDKQTMLIRLSNTKPGAITVTRSAKAMKNDQLQDIVKHKRYFPSEDFGKLTLTGSWGERQVTWDGLLAHLKQKECCICLEELKDDNDVLRINCGHHFHRHCIERHVVHSKTTNGTEFAVCPLCRKKIENAELINEPSIRIYKKIPDINKSKSFNHLPPNGLKHTHIKPHNDMIQRAATEQLTPKANDMSNQENADLMIQMMKAQNNNNNAHQWANHLDVNHNQFGFSDEEDD